jgi:hypothetical protein
VTHGRQVFHRVGIELQWHQETAFVNERCCFIMFQEFFGEGGTGNDTRCKFSFSCLITNPWKVTNFVNLIRKHWQLHGVFPEDLQPLSCSMWLPNIINSWGWGLLQLRPCFWGVMVGKNILLMTSLHGTGTVISNHSAYSIDTSFSVLQIAYQFMPIVLSSPM